MEDTIAAISTAYGEGGIGIIRISGENTSDIIRKIFRPAGNNNLDGRKMTYGNIVDPLGGKIVDEVLCVLMKAPATYTREDVAEINCHGSLVSQRRILEIVISCGARLAEPGEFTKRAFLNGRLDLSQAEAVIDVIKARTDKTFDVAFDQMEGKFSSRIRDIRNKLTDILVDISVNIDYPDEDIEQMTYKKLDAYISNVTDDLKYLLSTADTGRILREGLNVAIIGKPNVGKSSLMNSLLMESRAIVTEMPGTTRDVIEESISIDGVPVNIIDTAGIRDTTDKIEIIGIEKSKESFNKSDLVLFMIDASRALDEDDLEIADIVKKKKSIVILNKTDLPNAVDREKVKRLLPGVTLIETSLTEDKGTDEIRSTISRLVYSGNVRQEDSVLVTNVRHCTLMKSSADALKDAEDAIKRREPLELIEIDVNHAYELMGEIIGESASEDIINEVFSRFCLGK